MDVSNIVFIVNFGLIFANAIVDFAALPFFVTKHAKPESDPMSVIKCGRVLIAFQVGAYTLIVMWLHTLTWYYSLIFTTLILIDASMSIRAIIIKRGTSHVSKP